MSLTLPAATPIGQLIAGLSFTRKPSRSGGVHRTGRPIHRSSKEEGSFERTFFAELPVGDPDRIKRAVRAAEDEARTLKRRARAGESLSARERKVALVTPAVARIGEAIADLARLCKGWVYPSWEKLAELTGIERSSVGRAIGVLEAIGAITKQRRFKMVEQDDGSKAYRQTSSCYQVRLPDILRSLLPKRMRPPPPPADSAHHVREQDRETHQMLARASCTQQAEYLVDPSTPLGKQLRRLGASLDQCELQNSTAPLPKSL